MKRILRRTVLLVVLSILAVGWYVGPAPAAGSTKASSIVHADFDNDGRDDLAIGAPGEDIGVKNSAGAVNIVYGGPGGVTTQGSEFFHQDKGGVNDTAQEDDHFGLAIAAGDFDDDGFEDLAVGVPNEQVNGVGMGGGVHVFYGRDTGLGTARNKFWTQNTDGVKDKSESTTICGQGVGGQCVTIGDRFGQSVAAADYDRDGFDDLAIGVPGETVGGADLAGAVAVLSGGADGLTAAGDQLWHQNTNGIKDAAAEREAFGSSLAAGNFGKGLRADLAIGIPGQTIGTADEAGAVHVLYGRSTGLHEEGDQFWSQDTPSLDGDPEAGDEMGRALAAGDFDGTGFDDLAIGVPNDAGTSVNAAGAVNVIYAVSTGLDVTDDQLWNQDSDLSGVTAPEQNDNYGFALAVANFGKGPEADLAVGVPGQELGAEDEAGEVNVIYGDDLPPGLQGAGLEVWRQTSVQDVPQEDDRFGISLSAGQFGNGKTKDLAVGVPLEDLVGTNEGVVHVIYGTPAAGLEQANNDFLSQGTAGMAGDGPEDHDNFGFFFFLPSCSPGARIS